MKSDVINRGICFLVLGSLAIFLSACAAGFQVSGDLVQGQSALFAGNYPSALSLFQSAAQADPNSVVIGGQLRQGTLSYLGRAQYLNGQLEAARATLQKTMAQPGSENNLSLTQLYLGLHWLAWATGKRVEGYRKRNERHPGFLELHSAKLPLFSWPKVGSG
jgi:tetratricopeptide (TPR) repeat protein